MFQEAESARVDIRQVKPAARLLCSFQLTCVLLFATNEFVSMIIFLSIAFSVSLVVILLGFWADHSAVSAQINGANGLPILVALVTSFLGSLAVAVLAWLLDSFEMLIWVLLFTVPYHLCLGGLLIWRLQSLATRVRAAEEARMQKFLETFDKPDKL